MEKAQLPTIIETCGYLEISRTTYFRQVKKIDFSTEEPSGESIRNFWRFVGSLSGLPLRMCIIIRV